VQTEIKWSPINRWRCRWTGSGQFSAQSEEINWNCSYGAINAENNTGGFCVSVWCLNHTASKWYVQQLSDEDHRRPFDFCLQLQDLMSSDYHFLEKVQLGEEATFHVSGAVYRRNVRIWGSENPHAYVEHQRDSHKVNEFEWRHPVVHM